MHLYLTFIVFKLSLLLLVLTTFIGGCAVKPTSYPIIEDERWSSHTLPNGFTYYLYPTESDEIELRLIVNVGSIQEEESERGYAHFIEHMAFSSTDNFPNESVMDQFNNMGLEMGYHANAFTDYTRTVYQVSLPNNENIIPTLKWLSDIPDGIHFNDEEIFKEVDIIHGEWRFDNIKEKPWSMKLYDALLHNSVYENKDPIGTKSSLDKVTPEKLKRFYERWYQPNRMKLVIVGGINQENMVSQLQQLFSSDVKNRPAAYQFPTLANKTQYPQQLEASMGENSALVLSFDKGNFALPVTIHEQQEMWLNWLTIEAIEERLYRQLNQYDSLPMNVYFNLAFIPGREQYEIVLEHHAEDRHAIITQFAESLASLSEFGVSKSEFQTQIEQFETLSFLLFSDNPFDIAENAVHELSFNQLPQDEIQLGHNFNDFLLKVNREMLNHSIHNFLKNPSKFMTVVYEYSEVERDHTVDAKMFFSALSAPVKNQFVIPDVIELPKPDLSHKTNSNVQIITINESLFEWKLPNGIGAQFYQLDDNSALTHIIFRAKGGISSLTRKERSALDMLYETYMQGNILKNRTQDFLNGMKRNGIFIQPAVLGNTQDFRLIIHTDQIAQGLIAFRYLLLHLQPDEDAFNKEKSRLLNHLNELSSSPYDVFKRSVKNFIYPKTSYDYPISKELYQEVTFKDVQDVYEKLFGDLGHFDLYIVSDQPVEKVSKVLSAHLGDLALTRKETLPQKASFNQKGGTLIEHLSPEDRTFIETLHVFDAGMRNTDSLFIEEMLTRILQKRYTKIMRENYALDYDPQISSWGKDGDNIHITTITALIAPEKEQMLNALWPDIVKQLTSPVSTRERNLAAKSLKRDIQNITLEGYYMVSALARYGTWGYDQNGLLNPDIVINRINKDKLNTYAHRIFNNSIHFQSILRPKKHAIKTQ